MNLITYLVVSPFWLGSELHKPAKQNEEPCTIDLEPKVAKPLVESGSLKEFIPDAGELVGGVTIDGKQINLSEMNSADLKKIATDLGVEYAQKMNKAALVAAIQKATSNG